MKPQRVLIIGGGAIGSAIACALTDSSAQAQSPWEVTVIERDPSYARASSALSASSIRQQFSSPINIAISRHGLQVLRSLPEVGLHEGGYLYLATAAGQAVLRERHAVQRAHGADVALLPPDALQQRFGWLNVQDIALGSLGLSGEGWFDGYALLQAFRTRARAQGVRYLRAEAVGLELSGSGRVQAVVLDSGERLPCDAAVNAAGPWARRVAAWAGIDLPVFARRRTVFSVRCPQALPGCPLLIDPSGIWLRPEGQGFITGFAPRPESDADDLPLDEPELEAFEAHVWPTLAARIPAFEALRMERAWAGYYEMNVFDHNAIVGLHPACENLYFANGFSGHGLQQAPAVGRALAELMRQGAYQTLDLAPLGWARVLAGEPLQEANVI